MKKKSKVSVVIPTHNRANLIERAIKSVQNQTVDVLEIIVVSDGSTDNTKEVVESLQKQDKRIKFIEYHPSINGNHARNIGIDNVKGEYIAFLDDDDEWLPKKIELQLKKFKESKNIGIVYSAQNAIYLKENLTYQTKPTREGDLSNSIFYHNYIGTPSQVMVKTDIIKKAGKFDLDLNALQDYDLWIRVCQLTQVGVVPHPCINYYNDINNNQISSKTNKYIDASRYILNKYKEIIKKFPKKEIDKIEANLDLLISKKYMRNRNKKNARKYAIKAFKKYKSLKALEYILVSNFSFEFVLKLRKIAKF